MTDKLIVTDGTSSGLSTGAAISDTDYLELQQSTSAPASTVNQQFSAIKTWIKSWIAKADVGLGNVANSLQLVAASNLSDLASAPAAILNLGASPKLYSTYVASRYYGLPFYSYTGTATPTASRAAMIPFFVLQKVTISTIDIRTAAGATGNWQAAIYASDAATCRPTGTPLAQSSASASTAGTNTNVDSAFTSNVQLLPGVLYWLGFNTDTSTPTYSSMSSVLGGPQLLGSTTNTETLGAGLLGLWVSQTLGTWPDMTSQSFTALSASSVPGMTFKVASVP